MANDPDDSAIWKGSERRQHPRAAVAFDIELQGPDAFHRASVKDISASGVCYQSDTPMPEMSLVQIELVLPDDALQEAIRAQGAVVRCEPVPDDRLPSYEVAIFFTDLGDEDRRRIARYVDRKLSSAPS